MTTDTDIAEVVAADDQRRQAMTCGDVETLENVLHDNFYYTHFSGWSEGKSAYIARIRARKVVYSDVRTANVVTYIYTDAAVMHGRMWMNVFVVDERRNVAIDNQFTAVWVRSEGQWRIVAWASTPVSESARTRA